MDAEKVAFIDTENTFRPDRIRSIAERFNGLSVPIFVCLSIDAPLSVDANAALDNILVGRAHNSEHQMDLITALAAKFAEDGSFRLLIVDSILALFRVDYSGRGELSERQQKLNQMLSRLTRISEEYNVAVFVLVFWLMRRRLTRRLNRFLTNQVQSDPGASSMFAGAADKKPVGGHVMAHASATRLYLRKGRGDKRYPILRKSSNSLCHDWYMRQDRQTS